MPGLLEILIFFGRFAPEMLILLNLPKKTCQLAIHLPPTNGQSEVTHGPLY